MIRFVLLLIFGFATERGQSWGSSKCNYNELPCINGQCIKRNQWCDGDYLNPNCEDKSDERFCRKGFNASEDPNKCKNLTSLFLCRDGTCIPTIGRCDGAYDCLDSSDEKNCDGSSYRNDIVVPKPVHAGRKQNRSPHNYHYTGDSSLYKDLPYANYELQLSFARDWLKSQRKNYGWGDDTARAVIAMYLSRKNVFPKSKQDLMMDKQLDFELFVALKRNETNTMTLSELALYINSLLAACKNPRNFYGDNLVNILRERTNKAYPSTKFVSPLVHLTLCLSNVTEHKDVQSLQSSLNNQNILNKVDIISLAVLASSCIIKIPLYSHSQYRENFVRILLDKLKISGLPGNIYELSLATQALNEAKVNPLKWGRHEAIQLILNSQKENGSFGDILATYYTIPILSGQSLLSLSDHCSKDFSNGKTPHAFLKKSKKRKISVKYSLQYGDPVEISQKVKLKVAEGTNFLDVMRLAEERDPDNFRFNLDETKNVPSVYSIGGMPNDAERGLYWTLHIRSTRNPEDFIPYGRDIKELIPHNGDEMRFWLKQIE